MALTTIDDRGLKTPIDLLDNEKIRFGTGNDLEIYHDGSHSHISDTGTGGLKVLGSDIYIRNPSDQDMIHATSGGAVKLYYNNSKKFETRSAGTSTWGDAFIYGSEGVSASLYLKSDEGDDNGDGWRINSNQDDNDLTISNDITGSYVDKLTLQNDGDLFTTGDLYIKNDSKKLKLGAGDDLQIYHDGSNSYITNATGHVELNSSWRWADNARVRCGASSDLEIYHDGSNSYIDNTTGTLHIRDDSVIHFASTANEDLAKFTANGSVELYYDNSKKAETTSSGFNVSGKITAEVTGTNTVAATFINSGSHSDGTEVQIKNSTGTPADGDQTGYLQFSGMDSNGNGTIYNAIIGYMDDVTDGTEDGTLKFFCRSNGGFSQRLAIAADGTFTGSGNNDISDQRLKENIATVVDPIAKIKALKGRTFTWKPEANLPEGTKYGFIAQEVEAVVSDLVDNKHGLRQFDKDNNLIPQDEKAKINKDEGTTEAKAVHATGVVPILVEALKEALSKIETLETKVAALESK